MKIQAILILLAVTLLTASCSGSRRSCRHETAAVSVESRDSLMAVIATQVMESLKCSVSVVIDRPHVRVGLPFRDTVAEVEFTAGSIGLSTVSASDMYTRSDACLSDVQQDISSRHNNTVSEKCGHTKFLSLPVIAAALIIVTCAVRVIKMFM